MAVVSPWAGLPCYFLVCMVSIWVVLSKFGGSIMRTESEVIPTAPWEPNSCSASWSLDNLNALCCYSVSGTMKIFLCEMLQGVTKDTIKYGSFCHLGKSCWIFSFSYLIDSLCLSQMRSSCAATEKCLCWKHFKVQGARDSSHRSGKLLWKECSHLHFRYLQCSGIARN